VRAIPIAASWCGRAGDLAAVEGNAPGRRLEDSADQVEQGRLPGAVRADDRNDLGRIRAERDAIDRADAAEVHGDVVDFEEPHTSRSDFA
jgi:hypothetical protein